MTYDLKQKVQIYTIEECLAICFSKKRWASEIKSIKLCQFEIKRANDTTPDIVDTYLKFKTRSTGK